MLPLPGFVRRAIFAESEPEVEYHVRAFASLLPLAVSRPYLVAQRRTRKAGLRLRTDPLISPTTLAPLRNQHGKLESLLVV